MNVFQTHTRIVEDYATYIRSFLKIADSAIRDKVEDELNQGKLWPEPLLQFNPSFERFSSLADLAAAGTIHPDIRDIFTGYTLYRHQVEAIQLGTADKDFIVTSGTGSGKSLTYIGTIFHHLLSNPTAQGVTAVAVYPMNALINSQFDEFERYQANYEQATGKPFPITFGQYTGQENEAKRTKMREEPPQILLTNYMMLELLLTRLRERPIRDGIFANLRFLVFDELHTYRGRQGADVALLIRRIRTRCAQSVVCIGTSATMVSGGTLASQRAEVAKVATKLFGKPFTSDQVVNETLARSLDLTGALPSPAMLATAIQAGVSNIHSVATLKQHPIAIWLENKVALETREGILVRGKPQRISAIVAQLATECGLPQADCRAFLEALLQRISALNQELQDGGHATRCSRSSSTNSFRRPARSTPRSIRTISALSPWNRAFTNRMMPATSRSSPTSSVAPVVMPLSASRALAIGWNRVNSAKAPKMKPKPPPVTCLSVLTCGTKKRISSCSPNPGCAQPRLASSPVRRKRPSSRSSSISTSSATAPRPSLGTCPAGVGL